MAKILMVEDSAQLREAVSDFFMNRSGGTLTVETAADGDEGMKAVTENTYDLVILDIMLPGPSGYMICKKLREKSDCPIVLLTALGTEDNILLGYEMDRDVEKAFSEKHLNDKMMIGLTDEGKMFFISEFETGAGEFFGMYDVNGKDLYDEDNPCFVGEHYPDEEGDEGEDTEDLSYEEDED